MMQYSAIIYFRQKLSNLGHVSFNVKELYDVS